MSAARTSVDRWPAWRGRFSRSQALTVLFFHILVLFAPFTYGRLEFFLFVLTTYGILQFGLVLGYHRQLSHRCFATYPWLRRTLSLLGTLAMQSGPITWVAIHRTHHRIAEQPLDPHSPKHGLSWAHFFWTFFDHPKLSQAPERILIARDLHGDRFIRFCEEKFILLNAAATVGVVLIGFGLGGLSRAFSFLVWIVALRAVCLWHITFLVNSVGHTLGYRNFNTPDDSHNVWILGLLALGDGWHNNHHAFPACAAHGRRWFEIDLTYILILLLERCGVVWRVRHALSNWRTQSQNYRANEPGYSS